MQAHSPVQELRPLRENYSLGVIFRLRPVHLVLIDESKVDVVAHIVRRRRIILREYHEVSHQRSVTRGGQSLFCALFRHSAYLIFELCSTILRLFVFFVSVSSSLSRTSISVAFIWTASMMGDSSSRHIEHVHRSAAVTESGKVRQTFFWKHCMQNRC